MGDPGLGRPGIAVVVGDLVHGGNALGLGAAGAGIVGVGRGGAVLVPCASCEQEGNGQGGTPPQSCSVQVHAGKLSPLRSGAHDHNREEEPDGRFEQCRFIQRFEQGQNIQGRVIFPLPWNAEREDDDVADQHAQCDADVALAVGVLHRG